MAIISNILEAEQIDILIEMEFEVDCWSILNLFDTEGSLLTASKEDNPASLVIDKYAIALKNTNGVTVGHVNKFLS